MSDRRCHGPAGAVRPARRRSSAPLAAACVLLLLGACSDEPRDWGPLAVVAGDGDSVNLTAALPGRLEIGAECVVVRSGGLVFMPVWIEEVTRWDAARRVVLVRTDTGDEATLADGDEVVLGGGYGARPSEWVSPPAASCPRGEVFGVHDVEVPAG